MVGEGRAQTRDSVISGNPGNNKAIYTQVLVGKSTENATLAGTMY